MVSSYLETAPYSVAYQDGNFEIRDYPSLRLVETKMNDGDNYGFFRLFNFI